MNLLQKKCSIWEAWVFEFIGRVAVFCFGVAIILSTIFMLVVVSEPAHGKLVGLLEEVILMVVGGATLLSLGVVVASLAFWPRVWKP